MQYKQTFTSLFKFNESDKKKMDELAIESYIMTIVERSKGFMEVYTKEGVNYTTEDILRKGL